MGGKLEKRKLKKLSAFRNKLFHQQEARISDPFKSLLIAVNPSPFGGEVRRGGPIIPYEAAPNGLGVGQTYESGWEW